jgi:hypothetical protein
MKKPYEGTKIITGGGGTKGKNILADIFNKPTICNTKG